MFFEQGLSGLNAAAESLSVLGKNIANSNTVGYKSASVNFTDIMYNSLNTSNSGLSLQTGSGPQNSHIQQSFSQGTISATTNPMDVAINGNGFFQMVDPTTKQLSYTRDGQFQLDAKGGIVNSIGQQLTGYTATNGLVNLGALVPINLSNSQQMVQKQTSLINANVSLDAGTVGSNALKITKQVGGALNLTSSPTTASFTAQDSQGVPKTVQLTLTQASTSPTNAWNITSDYAGASTVLGQVTFSGSGATSALAAVTTSATGITTSSNVLKGIPFDSTGDLLNIDFSNFTNNSTGAASQSLASTPITTFSTSVAANLNVPASSAVAYSASFNAQDINGVSHPVALTFTPTGTTNQWSVASSYLGQTSASVLGTIDFANGVGTFTPTPLSSFVGGATNTAKNVPFDGSGDVATINFSNVTSTNSNAAPAFTVKQDLPFAPTFDPSNPNSYGFTTATTVYDATGVAHNLQLYFAKNQNVNTGASSTWNVYSSPGASGATGSFSALGQVDFNSTGAMIATSTASTKSQSGLASATGVGAKDKTFTGVPIDALGDTATLDLSAVAQLAGPSYANSMTQDGHTTGIMTKFNIGADGQVVGTYSNGQSLTLAQVALAKFASPTGLQALGNNSWVQTAYSGVAVVGAPGTGGLGALQSSALESSNTDQTADMVGLLAAQRAYQANAQTIKAEDQIAQTLVNLG